MSPVVERKLIPGEEVGGGGASTGVAQQQQPQPPQMDTLATPSLVPLPDESPQSDLIPASSTAALLPPPPTPSASVVPPPSQDPQVRFAVSFASLNLSPHHQDKSPLNKCFIYQDKEVLAISRF